MLRNFVRNIISSFGCNVFSALPHCFAIKANFFTCIIVSPTKFQHVTLQCKFLAILFCGKSYSSNDSYFHHMHQMHDCWQFFLQTRYEKEEEKSLLGRKKRTLITPRTQGDLSLFVESVQETIVVGWLLFRLGVFVIL
mmetsp:Transcript_21383/g.32309  ORF Transcript_21383/g.32309 Transcript_21383/m.32309 type:complete len:138 (+) Transcript_21383:147-560(+)